MRYFIPCRDFLLSSRRILYIGTRGDLPFRYLCLSNQDNDILEREKKKGGGSCSMTSLGLLLIRVSMYFFSLFFFFRNITSHCSCLGTTSCEANASLKGGYALEVFPATVPSGRPLSLEEMIRGSGDPRLGNDRPNSRYLPLTLHLTGRLGLFFFFFFSSFVIFLFFSLLLSLTVSFRNKKFLSPNDPSHSIRLY